MSGQPIGGGELSQFEQLSALTPKKTPYAIIGGAVLVVVLLIILNQIAPTSAVDDLKKKEAKKADAAAVQPAGDSPAGDIDDL